MFIVKVRSKISNLLISALLILFVLSNSVAMFHAFLHRASNSNEVKLIKAELSHKSFFEKIIFSHNKSSDKKSEHCFLCAASNFQNQIFLTPNLIFATAVFYLVFALRYLDRAKLSYLFSLKAPRAPPVIF